MPTQVKGSGLLSLVKDFGAEFPKSRLVAAAGYIYPDGKLQWHDFYSSLMEAKGAIPVNDRRTNEEDQEYDSLSSQAQELYDKVHEEYGEKWDHDDIMQFMQCLDDEGVDSVSEYENRAIYCFEDWQWQKEFIEEMSECMESIPEWCVVDYEATWDYTFRYDYSMFEHDGCYWVISNC